MEILNSLKYPHEGNDCMIYDYVCLILLDSHLYLVTHTEQVYGSWTGNPTTTKCETFEDYNDALDYMDKIVKELGINDEM